MQAQIQIPKPANWQDFEILCMKLWDRMWDCKEIKRNGRLGQEQHGVDIFVLKNGDSLYTGIQCKLKDDLTHRKLTKKEIDAEVEKALFYKNELKQLIFVTTAHKDAEIEDYVRKKNLEHISRGLFEIYLYSWEDIVDLSIQLEDIKRYDMSITFQEGSSQIVIQPQYVKKVTKYVLPSNKMYQDYLLAEQKSQEIVGKLHPLYLKDVASCKEHTGKSWCRIPVCIKNIGTIDIDIVKIRIDCNEKNVYAVSNHIPAKHEEFMSSWDSKIPEIVTCANYDYGLLYQPPNGLIVSHDKQSFEFYIKPKENVEQFDISFEIIAKNGYHSTSSLAVKVMPEYHRKYNFVVVNSMDEIKEDKVEIFPYDE